MNRCAYADHTDSRRTGSVACSGPVIFTAHDRRGCVDVCFAHATWRMTTSLMPGHSLNCPCNPRNVVLKASR